jgi:hypothetical protein
LYNIFSELMAPQTSNHVKDLYKALHRQGKDKWFSQHLQNEHPMTIGIWDHHRHAQDLVIKSWGLWEGKKHVLNEEDTAKLRYETKPALKILIDTLQAEEWSHGRKTWENWAQEALVGSGRQAHNYTKKGECPPECIVPSTDGGQTSHFVQVLKCQRDKWDLLWRPPGRQDVDDVTGMCGHNESDEIPVFGASIIRAVSRSYKEHTTKVDGWHPRQYSQLSDAALNSLGILFAIYQRRGKWAKNQSDLLVRLIPKGDGDRRPILHFRSGYRLWARMQRRSVKNGRPQGPAAQ